MGRGKLKLKLIANERARKTTFQKRKMGIMKKAYEFSVLCDVDMCLMVSAPQLDKDDEYSNNRSSETIETFPPERGAVLKVVNKYRAALKGNSLKKAYSLTDMVAERKRKVDIEVARCGTELLEGLSAEELKEFVVKLDDKINSVRLAIEAKKEVSSSSSSHDHVNDTTIVNGTEFVGPTSSWAVCGHFNAIDAGSLPTWGPVLEDWIVPGTMMLGAGAGALSLCPYYYPLPPIGMQPVPNLMQYPVSMSLNLDPGIRNISPVIKTACEGNSELCSVVNSIMRNMDKRA